MPILRRTLTFFALALLLAACADADPDARLRDRAERIHEDALIIDSHVDISSRFAAEVNPCDSTGRQVDLPKMEAGHMDAAFFIVFVGQGPRTDEGYAMAEETALERFAAIRSVPEELCPDRAELALGPDDVGRISADGKHAILIGIENGYVIGRDLTLLETYYDLGARYMTLSHNGHNDITDSANPGQDEPEAEHGGLSAFGEAVVAEMNRLGMLVDVSHISGEAVLDAVRVSEAPVMASHSATKALTPIPRNLGDEQLRAIAEKGGVVQIVGLDQFVKAPPPEKEAALDSVREAMGVTSYEAWRALSDADRDAYRQAVAEIDERWPGGSVSDLVDHIDYAVELIGIDHVGIGSDFDGGGGVRGWENAAETLNVTLELVRRGYSEPEIQQLWGRNLLRVWRDADEIAGG